MNRNTRERAVLFHRQQHISLTNAGKRMKWVRLPSTLREDAHIDVQAGEKKLDKGDKIMYIHVEYDDFGEYEETLDD